MNATRPEMEDLRKTLSSMEAERDYYRQVAKRLGQKALSDAQDYAHLIQDLRQREGLLRQSQDTLEKTIAERTAELLKKNQELHKSTNRYDSLVKRIPHGVYTLCFKSSGAVQFEYLSPPLCQILDVDPEKVKNDASLAFSIAHPDDRDELERSTFEATKLLSAFHWEGRFIIRQNVRWIRIEAEPTLTLSGDVIWNGVLSDITERRHTQKKLKESEERLNFLFKNSSDGQLIINSDRSLRFVSHAIERHTGYTIGELEGRVVDTLIHPEDFLDVMAAFTEAVEHPEKIVTVQYRNIHKTKEWIFLEARGQSFLTDPAINGIIASVRDITERKQAEAEKTRLQEQLIQAQKMESVGLLAGGVAHEFNNMLGVILGNAEMCMDQSAPFEPHYDHMDEIHKAAVRSTEITRQLLAFARKQNIAPKIIDLNQAIELLLKMLRRLIGENIELVCSPVLDLWTIKADPSQINQILTNLCLNARDAISGVGRITIETGNRFLDENYCRTHPGCIPGEYVWLSVTDTGCGINKQHLDHIFEPFFTTKDVGKGTGLGLAMVYGAVKQNGGTIDVSSKAGKNTVFTIYLPRYDETKVPIKSEVEKETVTPVKGSRETILLVEDEPSFLHMTATMLKRLGYSVLEAGSPREAIVLAEEFKAVIHLIITDVIMPEMNGQDLVKKLMTIQNGMKCLFMSGHNSNIIGNHGILNEGIDFILKPFSKKELDIKIRSMLD